jgi:tRNA-dihydrouridine synthase
MQLHLAPLHGVTNRVFREAYFRHFSAFDGAMAPFVGAVPGGEAKLRHFKDLLPGPAAAPLASAHPPLAAQILGNEAAAVADTAGVLVGLGYDEIDLNLGCPYSMVANKRRGSGLLPYPEKVGELLDALCAVKGARVSAKVRLGRFDPSEILKLMPILNAAPLARVIIHPRIGVQMYRGVPDLDGFERAAGLCGHPVVYNGNIASREDFESLASRFTWVDSWMIGRGAIANPFLPEEIKGNPALRDRDGRLRSWHDDLYRSYQEALCGPGHLLDKMKELWSYLRASFPDRKRQLEAISRTRTKAEYERAAAALLGPH